MKLTIKRGPARSGGSDAAEKRAASRVRGAAAENLPAPVGTLHRAFVGGYAPAMDDGPELADAQPSRTAARLRAARELLRSRSGRLIAGGVCFFVLGGAAAAVFGMRSWLTHDERFMLASSSDVAISGNAHITRGQVLSVFGADLQRNIFKVPLAERRADIERLPWVEHATVMRLLPGEIRIALTERTPVAFVRQGSTIGLVDASGVLLDMPENTAGDPGYSFPVLTGLSADDTAAQRAARMEVYKRFLTEINAGGEKLSEKVSEVDVTNPEDVRAVVAGAGADIVVHFGDEDFLNRFHHLEQHLDDWRRQYPKLSAADLRYERQVVLEMQGGAQGSAAGAQGTAATDALSAGSAPASTATSTAAVAAASPAHAAAATRTALPSKPAVPAAKPAVTAAHPHDANAHQSAANQRVFAALAAARHPHGNGAATVTRTPPAGADK